MFETSAIKRFLSDPRTFETVFTALEWSVINPSRPLVFSHLPPEVSVTGLISSVVSRCWGSQKEQQEQQEDRQVDVPCSSMSIPEQPTPKRRRRRRTKSGSRSGSSSPPSAESSSPEWDPTSVACSSVELRVWERPLDDWLPLTTPPACKPVRSSSPLVEEEQEEQLDGAVSSTSSSYGEAVLQLTSPSSSSPLMSSSPSLALTAPPTTTTCSQQLVTHDVVDLRESSSSDTSVFASCTDLPCSLRRPPVPQSDYAWRWLDSCSESPSCSAPAGRVLGSGTFCTVIMQNMNGLDVVVKMFKGDCGLSLAMVIYEVDIAAYMGSRGIGPRVLGLQWFADTAAARGPSDLPSLVMEYLPQSCDMLSLLTDGLTLTSFDVLDVLVQAANLLVEMHELSFLHNDVKLNNILIISVTKSGPATDPTPQLPALPPAVARPLSSCSRYRVYLIDFGEATYKVGAQVKLDEDKAAAISQYPYLAPELISGVKSSQSTDVYSFGMAVQLTTEIIGNLTLSEALSPITQVCTRRQPDKRPTMLEVEQALLVLMSASGAPVRELATVSDVGSDLISRMSARGLSDEPLTQDVDDKELSFCVDEDLIVGGFDSDSETTPSRSASTSRPTTPSPPVPCSLESQSPDTHSVTGAVAGAQGSETPNTTQAVLGGQGSDTCRTTQAVSGAQGPDTRSATEAVSGAQASDTRSATEAVSGVQSSNTRSATEAVSGAQGPETALGLKSCDEVFGLPGFTLPPQMKWSSIQASQIVESAHVLGEGTFADVILGRWGSQQVVVKRFVPLEATWKESMNKVMGEADVSCYLGALGIGPRLLGVLESTSQEDQVPSLVLQYLPGAFDFHTLLLNDMSLTRFDVVDLMTQIASLLAHIHNKGFVHNDMKLVNTLVAPLTQQSSSMSLIPPPELLSANAASPEDVAGKEPQAAATVNRRFRAYLIDFGETTYKDGINFQLNEEDLLEFAQFPYLPPEVINTNTKSSSSTDVYSFGMMLRQCGHVLKVPSLVADWAHLTDWCTSFDPLQRPTMEEVTDSLVLLNQSSASKSPKPLQRGRQDYAPIPASDSSSEEDACLMECEESDFEEP